MAKQLLVALALSIVVSPAYAVLTFTLKQQGPNVVATVSGSVNTTAIPASGTSVSCNGTTGVGAFQPGTGTLCVAGSGAIAHPGLVGPTNFGSGPTSLAASGTGDIAYVQGSSAAVFLPDGYVSGTPLSGSSVFAGTTLDAMVDTRGTYTYTFGTGPTADRVVVIIGEGVQAAAAPIPALGEHALLALGALLVVGAALALRKSAARG